MSQATDITTRADSAAVVLLVSFAETVSTKAGRVEPDASGFTLNAMDRRPKRYATALPAVRALRKLTKGTA